MVFFLSDQTGSFDKSLKPERGEKESLYGKVSLRGERIREWMEFLRVRNRSESIKHM